MKFIPILFLAIFLSACSSTPVKQVEAKKALERPTYSTTKKLFFKKVVAKLKRGQAIGGSQTGVLCIPSGNDLHWKSGQLDISSSELTEVLREEFEKSSIAILTEEDSLFESQLEEHTDFIIAGLIKDIQMNICYPMSGFNNYSSSKGEGFLKVEWQVYSKVKKKIVYKTSTEGSSKLSEAGVSGAASIMLQAFSVATNNLLAEEKFHSIISTESTEAALNSSK